MIKGNTFLSYYTVDDFRAAFGASSDIAYVGESTPGANQYAWNSTFKSVRVKTDASTKGYLSFDLGFLELGDTVDLEADIWNMSGDKVRLTFDHFAGSGIDDGTRTTFYIDTIGEGGFKLSNYPFVVTKPGYYRATIGLWTSQVGEYRMRNAACKIQSVVRNTEPLNRLIHFRLNISNGSPTITYRKGKEYVQSIVNDGNGFMVNLKNTPANSAPFLQYIFTSSQAYRISSTESISYMYMRGSGANGVLVGLKKSEDPTETHKSMSSVLDGSAEIRIHL